MFGRKTRELIQTAVKEMAELVESKDKLDQARYDVVRHNINDLDRKLRSMDSDLTRIHICLQSVRSCVEGFVEQSNEGKEPSKEDKIQAAVEMLNKALEE